MKRKIAAILLRMLPATANSSPKTRRKRCGGWLPIAPSSTILSRAGGRIFNTAGDAVLAEFSSTVEAVRCAVDIQESLRTRNLAYPPSRQMSFRIGITVGDVVERGGDLLGDGVNIAARLQGIAPVGGICISRTVYEQVANKLSVQFADIGEQHVKNIPNPVHAYKVEMRPDDSRIETAPAKTRTWRLPAAITAAGLLAVGIAAFVYVAVTQPIKPQASSRQSAPQLGLSAPPAAAVMTAPSGAAERKAPRQADALVPETIPFIADRLRAKIRNEYLPAPDHKALTISAGPIGLITGQADDESAKVAALGLCQQRASALPQQHKCELYAISNRVVYARGQPPMPPTPWFSRDRSIERPMIARDLPLVNVNGKAIIEERYGWLREPKVLVIGPGGGFFFVHEESVNEAARRALEICGSNAGVPCMIVAVNNDFVVPVPMTMKATGFFHPGSASAIASELRADIDRRIANAGAGWMAVAAGAGGQTGLALNAATEPAATGGALADCAKHDHSCRVIAIGPFTVEPK